MGNPPAESLQLRGAYRRVAAFVLVLNLISAALFIGLVNRPVYDDGFNIYDVHNYASNGFSLQTLRSQRNPPGPASFAWMAIAVRRIGGSELRDARIGALFSWVLLGIVVLVGARFGSFPGLWYAAFLTLLVFPHSVEASATVLTEGPAMFFVVAGSLAWTEFVSRENSGAGTLIIGLLGCLSLGLAITCRQYNLALLPAAALVAAYQFGIRKWDPGQKSRWAIRALFCLVLSGVPVVLLLLVWKGIASPGMESGASYNMMYKASAGLNLMRPLIAAIYTGVYLVPLTFPLLLRAGPAWRWGRLSTAILGGIAAGYWSDSLIEPGPLSSALNLASKVPHGREILFGLIVIIAIQGAIAVGAELWKQRSRLLSSPPVAFALLVIIFFIGEQFGVGGNIPFYDRYVLQVAPFLGVLAFALLPVLDNARLFSLAALSLFSHFMLWRYAFSH